MVSHSPAAPQPSTKEAVLAALAAGKIGVDQASSLLSTIAPPKQNLHAKVSEKGAVSVYGLQRMPVTLYVGQWERLLAFAGELQAFIDANRSRLSVKS